MSAPKFATTPTTALGLEAHPDPHKGTVSPVVELRQYTLKPGGRETLIGLFDSHFVEPQEDAGISVIGQFRDLDRPDMFVWLRGFPDMASRRESLADFYGGAAWAAHRDAANATMIDSDDVLLLKPAWQGAGFDLMDIQRPALTADADHSTLAGDSAAIAATIWHVDPVAEEDFVSRFRREAIPLLASLGTPVIAAFVSEHAENTFPRLPIRASENVVVAFTRLDGRDMQERSDNAPEWQAFLASARKALAKPTERLRLSPTSRSRLR